jgi:hypothetical protein
MNAATVGLRRAVLRRQAFGPSCTSPSSVISRQLFRFTHLLLDLVFLPEQEIGVNSGDWKPPSWIIAPPDAANREMRKRIERLLGGERKTEDLRCLFSDQRFRTEGRSVREIGDFIAHRDRRDKGAVFEVVADLYGSAHFWTWTQIDLPAALEDLSVAAGGRVISPHLDLPEDPDFRLVILSLPIHESLKAHL